MDKEFIPHEQALELKKLGFTEKCLAYYDINKDLAFSVSWFNLEPRHYTESHLNNAPLYQQAFRWFREKYKIVHEIQFGSGKIWIRYGYNSFVRGLEVDNNNGEFYHTYEEAELACLKQLIEIVKNK